MRALLSVWDKSGLVELARGLHELGWELVSSGGTATAIADAGIPVVPLADVTGFPEMLDHRVVTLHPKVHGGILADRAKQSHLDDMEEHGIAPFDMVVTNLYPFVDAPGIETIDIGGPAMTRAAAKNHAFVAVVTSPNQYAAVLGEIRDHGGVGADTRRALALEAFAHTAAYDAAIVDWLQGDEVLPRHLRLALERVEEPLRYGENPHQEAARYRVLGARSWWDDAVQHSGMALSYLNYYDADAAWTCVYDLQFADGDGRPACAIIKHANPSGAAVADDLAAAYRLALDADELSAFGGIVAFNRPLDAATAELMVSGPQADVVIAPGYADGTIEALRKKRKNTRVLEAPAPQPIVRDFRQLSGGFLVQSAPTFVNDRHAWRVVTKQAPSESAWSDIELAWRLCGHVKSNCVVLVKDGQAVGIGAGQQSRVAAGEIAAAKAAGRAKGGVSATDGFYPFPDGIEAAIAAGVVVVVQPGGSVGDEKVIAAAADAGLAMVFTGERHFLH